MLDFPLNEGGTPATPAGTSIGPFTVGQTIQLRTRVVNNTGTTTGSTRTLKVVAVGG